MANIDFEQPNKLENIPMQHPYDDQFARSEDKPIIQNEQYLEYQSPEIDRFIAQDYDTEYQNRRKQRIDQQNFIGDDFIRKDRSYKQVISKTAKDDHTSNAKGKRKTLGSKSNLKKKCRARSKSKTKKKNMCKGHRSKSPNQLRNTETERPKDKGCLFSTALYERNRRTKQDKSGSIKRSRPQSVKKPSPRKMKTRIPNEKMKKDKKRYTIADLMKTRVTNASREGKEEAIEDTPFKLTSDVTELDQTNMMRVSLDGASKGRMTATDFVRADTSPKRKRKKSPKKIKSSYQSVRQLKVPVKAVKDKPKRKPRVEKSVPKKTKKRLQISPNRTLVIYDFDEPGTQIVKQETVHEYKQHMAYVSRGKKHHGSNPRKSYRNWDQTKCKKQTEFNKIIQDAWGNIQKQELEKLVANHVYEP